jgi:enolase
MSQITSVHAREILDSRGQPTIEVEVRLSTGEMGRAAVPSGASTGAHEALELRDHDPKRYHGKGVLKARDHVNNVIAPKLIGFSFDSLDKVEQALLALDPSPNKSKLGANAILGVSLACAKAAALLARQPLYRFLGQRSEFSMPVPLMNVINGGAHADNGLDIQEFMIVPLCGGTFREALRAGSEIFHSLKKLLGERKLTTSVGDEGGFAPRLSSNREALELLTQAVDKAGYRLGEDIGFALDVAATELYSDGCYRWQGEKLTAQELTAVYQEWSQKYPLLSIEDGLAEDDWSGWADLTRKLGDKLQLVGDDIFVTNPQRIRRGIEEHVANAVLIKVNQIGSLSETQNAIATSKKAGYATIMSHRSGETEDTTIADLAVAFGCQQIKTGSLCRSDRTSKYNQLLRIEEELGSTSAKYLGTAAFN